MKLIFRPFMVTMTLGTLFLQSACTKLPTLIAPSEGQEIPHILYRKDVNNIDELWTVKSDGSDKRKINITLTSDWVLENEDLAEVSTDGKTIVFLAVHSLTQAKTIYKCNIDGSGLTKVTEEGTMSIGIQDIVNNTALIYWKNLSAIDFTTELWSVNIDGTNRHKINISLPNGLIFGDEELAKVTSDGKTIVFLTTTVDNKELQALYKCNIDGSGVTLVHGEAQGYNLAIQSLLDNNTILYRKETDSSPSELWSVKLDGTGKRKIDIKLPADLELQSEEMAKSFQLGMKLIFSTENSKNGQQAIYISDVTGTGVSLVTEEAGTPIAIQSLY